MKTARKFLVIAAGTALAAGLSATAGAADVGVSISVAQPGFSGQFNFGDMGPAYYGQPVIVAPPQVAIVQPAPVYVPVPQYRWVIPAYAHAYWRDRDDDDHDRREWGHERGRGHGHWGHERDDD